MKTENGKLKKKTWMVHMSIFSENIKEKKKTNYFHYENLWKLKTQAEIIFHGSFVEYTSSALILFFYIEMYIPFFLSVDGFYVICGWIIYIHVLLYKKSHSYYSSRWKFIQKLYICIAGGF